VACQTHNEVRNTNVSGAAGSHRLLLPSASHSRHWGPDSMSAGIQIRFYRALSQGFHLGPCPFQGKYHVKHCSKM